MSTQFAEPGFDAHMRAAAEALQRPDCTPARVSRVDRERWMVRHGESDVQAEATGRLLYAAETPEDLPCVGDWVLAQFHDDGALAIIHAVLPRRTVLRRRAAGPRVDVQLIAVNIDTACIVQSCDENFNIRRLERYIVMAADGGIEPVVILNKCDLVDESGREELRTAIRDARIDARVLFASAVAAPGMEHVRVILEPGRTFCLLGSSGVGKTTILNSLLGSPLGRTAAVREQDGRGRHTTTSRQLIALDNGALMIDTPGMRELGMLDTGDGIGAVFEDILALAVSCRFADCTHVVEDGCAVRAAVDDGTLPAARYEHYLTLRRESEFYAMSYAERRRKDRDQGRVFKHALDEFSRFKPPDR